MNGKIVRTFSVALFILTLTGCGTNNLDITIPPQDDSNFSSFSTGNSSILEQIKSSTIEQTAWGINVKKLPSVNVKKKVTLLSYLAFDNDKGGYRDELRPMINFHEESGSSDLVNMILQTDAAEQKDTKRYFLINDTDTNTINSPYTQFAYERNSADYRVLQGFIKWGFSTYQSDIKILDIDNHGGAFMGIATDETSGKIISLPNLSKAIKASAGKIDILNMDACLMSTIEASYQLRDNAEVLIGSEDSTLSTGMLYTKSLPQIASQSKNNEDFATKILLASDRSGSKLFNARPNKKGKIPNVFTISAIRTVAVKPLVTELNNLSKLMLSKLSTQGNAIKSAINGSHPFYVDEDGLGGQRDLNEVLNRINTVVNDQEIKTATLRTRDALNKAIIISRANNVEKYAKGMAINISAGAMQNTDYQDTAFAKETSWDELIVAINK